MPKHDLTPDEEARAAIDENVRRGLMVEGPPGQYSLTEAGKAAAEKLMREMQGRKK